MMIWITRPWCVDDRAEPQIIKLMAAHGFTLTDSGTGFGRRDLGFQATAKADIESTDAGTLKPLRDSILTLAGCADGDLDVRAVRESLNS